MTNGNVRVVKWIYIFNNVKIHIRWFEYTYLIMWKHIFGYGNTRFWLRKDTGTMNRSLRLTGCSLRISRIVCWHFVECSQCFGNPSATFWQSVRNVLAIRSQCFGNPSAMFWQTVRSRRGRFIVPAYMKTPTKWRTEIRVRWFEYTYLIMWKHIFGDWIHIFNNVETHIRLWKYTFLFTQGYGRDESVPYA